MTEKTNKEGNSYKEELRDNKDKLLDMYQKTFTARNEISPSLKATVVFNNLLESNSKEEIRTIAEILLALSKAQDSTVSISN